MPTARVESGARGRGRPSPDGGIQRDRGFVVPACARTAAIRTFLIADLRGYTQFTAQNGDEAAARLAGGRRGNSADAGIQLDAYRRLTAGRGECLPQGFTGPPACAGDVLIAKCLQTGVGTGRARAGVRLIVPCVITLAGLLLSVPSLAGGPTTRWVDDDGHAGAHRGCADSNSASRHIQQAIDVSGRGDIVLVCPGTYRERLRIEGSEKRELTIQATDPWRAELLVPTAHATLSGTATDFALVKIDHADSVRIQWLKLVAPTAGDCRKARAMIRVTGDTHGVILRANEIVAAGVDTLGHCGYANGIAVQHGSRGTSTAWILYNTIQDFQRTGIKVAGTAKIWRNSIRFYHEAEATGCMGTGILAYGSDLSVHGNRAIGLPSAGATMGTPLLCTGMELGGRAADIRRNLIRYTHRGLALVSADQPVVARNTVLDSDYVGLLIGVGLFEEIDGDVVGGDIRRNVVHGSRRGTDVGNSFGVGASGVNVHDNDFSGNVESDCIDRTFGDGTANTDNTWTNNLGDPARSSPEGICSLQQ